MKTLRLLPLLVACSFFSGCIDIDKNVLVNADGSGTVVETVIMSKAMIDQMKGMAAAFGGKGEDPMKGMDFADEKKAKENAVKMGEGVTFVSAKKISNDKGEGATLTYAFKDITKLKLDQNPSSSAPQPPGGGGAVKAKIEPITFAFAKGSPAQLTVTMPALDPSKNPVPGGDLSAAGADDMAMQMMAQMFKDMRMRISVEVAGKIAETNAAYSDGKRVTLLEMDFNKLLANPEKMKSLTKANPKTIEDMKALVKGVDGVKVETSPTVNIKFK